MYLQNRTNQIIIHICTNLVIIVFSVSNIEAIQSQLKNIYTNTLSTLCPLPWLEEAEDVQYKFDDVFIPLRTIDNSLQQKTGNIQYTTESLHSIRYTITKYTITKYTILCKSYGTCLFAPLDDFLLFSSFHC